ncbi:MAG: class I SAM-dependent methyltransferase [Pirellulaceae bacterium]|jgi:SAM-dependent methyltransferase
MTDLNSSPETASVPSPLGYPLNDTECLIRLFSEVSGDSPESVCRRLYRDEVHIGDYHMEEFAAAGIEPHVWSDDLVQFYEKSDSFFIGSAAWNRRPEKIAMRDWIGRYLSQHQKAPLDLLTIGDGVGFDSLYFANCGHNATYMEVSHRAFDFAGRMFQLCDQSVKMLSEPAEIPEGAFDVVTCLDVLEHVPDPTKLVADMARYLRPDGMLIVHAPFFFVSQLVPTHLKSNRRYAGDLRKLYRPHGFRLIDGRTLWDPIVLQKCDEKEIAATASSARLLLLRMTGLLLAVGRYWSGIHNWFAHRAVRTGDSKWARELENSPSYKKGDGMVSNTTRQD